MPKLTSHLCEKRKRRSKPFVVSATALIAALCLLLSYVYIVSPEAKVSKAEKLIAQQKYADAYLVLYDLQGNKKAEKMLSKFIWKNGYQRYYKDSLFRFDYEYDGNGNQVVEKLSMDGSLQHIITTNYDDEGRIIKRVKTTYPTQAVSSVEEYLYGPHGITRYSNYGEHVLNTSIEYQHYDNGRLKSETHNKTMPNGEHSSVRYSYEYDSNGNVSLKTYSEHTVGLRYTAKYYYSYKYDKNGNCLSETKRDASYAEPPITVYENVYDKKGRLVKNIQKDGTQITEYEYDKNGNLIKEDDYKNDELHSEIIREYNKQGQLVKETTYQGSLTFITEYAYDKYGNIIKRAYGNQYSLTTVEYGDYIVFYKP